MDYKTKYFKYKSKYLNLLNQNGNGLPSPTPIAPPMPTHISSSSSSASALPMPIHVSSSFSSASASPMSIPSTSIEEKKYNHLLERISRLPMDSRRGELNGYISKASELAVNKSSSIARATIFDAITRDQIVSEYGRIRSDIISYKRTNIETWIALRNFITRYNRYPEFKSAFKPLYDMALDAMIAIRVAETLGVSLI